MNQHRPRKYLLNTVITSELNNQDMFLKTVSLLNNKQKEGKSFQKNLIFLYLSTIMFEKLFEHEGFLSLLLKKVFKITLQFLMSSEEVILFICPVNLYKSNSKNFIFFFIQPQVSDYPGRIERNVRKCFIYDHSFPPKPKDNFASFCSSIYELRSVRSFFRTRTVASERFLMQNSANEHFQIKNNLNF